MGGLSGSIQLCIIIRVRWAGEDTHPAIGMKSCSRKSSRTGATRLGLVACSRKRRFICSAQAPHQAPVRLDPGSLPS